MKKLTSIIIALIISCFCVSCTLPFESDRELYNKASTVSVKSCVKIIAENKKVNIFSSQLMHVNVGSGVIYTQTDGLYYVITNNHVTSPVDPNYAVDYVIYDCYGNSYGAELVKSSVEDDLAMLRFKGKTDIPLNVSNFSNTPCKIDDIVIAIGSPNGMFNTVTIGSVVDIKQVEFTDESTNSIEYPVICHTAIIDNGSSGGMLLNNNLEIVGINFAGGVDEQGVFVEGYAIPLEKVVNFTIEMI